VVEPKRYAEQIEPSTLHWVRAGEDTGENQVEIAQLPDGGMAMRESLRGDDGDVLWFTPGEWQAFVAGVKDGEFDLE
jgi:hypothetical protein